MDSINSRFEYVSALFYPEARKKTRKHVRKDIETRFQRYIRAAISGNWRATHSTLKPRYLRNFQQYFIESSTTRQMNTRH